VAPNLRPLYIEAVAGDEAGPSGEEKSFIDFAGKKPSIVDPGTGEEQAVELFVAALGSSSYVYAETAER
jgi:hypothetical protein